MSTVANVVAKFTADTSDLQAGAKRVTDSVRGVEGDVGKAAKGFTVLKGAMGTALGLGAVASIGGAALAIKNFAVGSVQAAKESQLTVRRLEQIASSMGVLDTVLGGSTQRLQDYAQSLQDQTGVNDETIKSAQAMILTFKDVASSAGQTGGMFDRTTVAALDLAAAGFGSVESNAKSLARALQDPLKGLTMLGRQGVTFTAIEKEKIKTLAESGRLLEAQEIIMAAVEKQVGGTAAATATSMDKMKASIADVQEGIGFALLPVIESIASAFQESVTPALMDFVSTAGPGIAEGLVSGFNDLLPILLDLGSAFMEVVGVVRSAMQPVLSALLAVVEAVIPIVSAFAEMLGSMPGPVLAAVGALLLLRTAIGTTLVTAFAGAKVKIGAAVLAIRGQVKAMEISVKTSMIAASTQAKALGAAFRAAGVTAAAGLRAIGVAAKGLMASIGPVGWALIGVSVAYEMIANKSSVAADSVNSLTQAMVDQGSVAGEQVAMKVASGLQGITAELAGTTYTMEQMMGTLGVSLTEVTTAALQGGSAVEALIAPLRAASDGSAEYDFALRNLEMALKQQGSFVAQAETQYRAHTAAQSAAAEVAGATASSYEDAARRQMAATREATAFARTDLGMLQTVTEATADAVRALQTAFEELNGVISQSEARDRMRDSLGELRAAFSDTESSNRQLRDATRQYMTDTASFAQGLKNPQNQLKVMRGALAEVRAQLVERGIDPENNPLYKSMKKAVEGAKDEVKNMKDAATEAEAAGLDVATSIAAGIEAGMTETAAALNAAGVAAGQEAIDGTNDILDIGSPSKVMMDAGKAAGEGLRLGLVGQAGAILSAGLTVGGGLISGMVAGLVSRSGYLYAVIQGIVAQAIAAAKAAAQVSSPSRLTMQLGEDLVGGMTVGMMNAAPEANRAARQIANRITRLFRQAMADRPSGKATSAFESIFGTREDIKNAARNLQDALWDLADAQDRIVEAEKALEEARKKGNAREIAAAERALAKARRDAADAADTAKLAQWVEENQKALLAFERMVRRYDYITQAMEDVQDALNNLAELVAQPFGLASELSQMFTADLDPERLAANFAQIEQIIREAYAVLTDPRIMGAKAARENTKSMNRLIRRIEGFVEEMIGLRQELDAGLIEEERLRGELDKANKAFEDANRELERIVSERDGFMQKITDGFRSFVNNLSGLTDQAAAQMKETVRELGNGVRLIIQAADPTSAAGAIVANLKSRLDEVRAFSANIQALMKRGLDPTLIRDFIEAGVSSAGATVSALAEATDDELAAINETQAALLEHSKEFAKDAAGAYYDPLIAGQQAIVDGLKAQVDAAQAALDEITARNEELAKQIEALGDRIENMVARLAARLPEQTVQAGQDAVDALIKGFEERFPEMKRYLNKLMDQLARSMRRTVQINVEANVGGSGGRSSAMFTPANTIALASSSAGRSVTIAPNAVNVTVNGSGSGVTVGEEVRRAVDESLMELAREIAAA